MTRLAIEYAATKGRKGKGCVITWAAGNGAEPVENDGYASHPDVMAIAACNERGERTVYSDYGRPISCCFPSGDYNAPNKPALFTKGLYVADRKGFGGMSIGDYTESFGGTSAACPGVAGVAALIISLLPHLTAKEVRKAIEENCEKNNPAAANYDSKGHSVYFGYGRVHALNAILAVQKADDQTNIAIDSIWVIPPKGNKEALIVRNASSKPLNMVICIQCGLKSELFTLKLTSGQNKTLSLKKVKLPNAKGVVQIRDENGTLLSECGWKKKELTEDGWKRNI